MDADVIHAAEFGLEDSMELERTVSSAYSGARGKLIQKKRQSSSGTDALGGLLDADQLTSVIGMANGIISGPAKSVNSAVDGVGDVVGGVSGTLSGAEKVVSSAKGLMGNLGLS